MPHYASASKSYDEGDYPRDDDNDIEEDDDYDCLSDYELDIEVGNAGAGGEGPSGSNGRRVDGYASRSSQNHNSTRNSAPSGSRHRNNFRHYHTTSERTASDHSDDNRVFSCRRDHHNHLERKRRASIKGSYCDLREAIPSLRGSKASRAVTLQRAAEYIETLTKSNQEHSYCVDELTRQNDLLERQVQELYRSYQRLETEVMTSQPPNGVTPQAQVVSSSSVFNAPAPPSNLAVTSSSPGNSTGNSTPTTAPLASSSSNGNGISSSGNSSTGFPIPLRLVSQSQSSTNSNTSSPDDRPPIGLAQLSYAALQIQQQQQQQQQGSATNSTSTSTAAKVTASPAVTTTATTLSNNVPSMTRLVTMDSGSGITAGPKTNGGPQRIRLSNSLSTSAGARPVVVVSTTTASVTSSSNPATTLSALDTAVIKARSARSLVESQPVQQPTQQQHLVIGSNLEVVSSTNQTNSVATQQPRRVVIVSAQHHQEYPAAVANAKL